MCKYSYSNGKCANIDIDTYLCVGERNCNISDILNNRNIKERSEGGSWLLLPPKIWNIGKRNGER
ncbi:MAG: hypothetical protein V3U20_09330 [Thermoplasmata archaeon]